MAKIRQMAKMAAVQRRIPVRVPDAQLPRRRPLAAACPQCGGPLRISSVNVSRCTRVGGAWRSAALCPACLFSELSIKPVSDWGQ